MKNRETEREGRMMRSGRVSVMFLGVGMMLLLMVMMMMRGGECAEVSPSECKQERQLGINFCKGVVFGQAASPACCQRIRVSHWECVCPAVDPKLAAVIDINKAIKILKNCGRAVPHHFKCGSAYFP